MVSGLASILYFKISYKKFEFRSICSQNEQNVRLSSERPIDKYASHGGRGRTHRGPQLFVYQLGCVLLVSRVEERGPRGGYVLGGWQERSGGVTVSTPTLQTQRAA